MSKIVALSYSKLRERVGLIGISVLDRQAYIRLALAWDVRDIKQLTRDVYKHYRKYRWDTTWIDQTTGEYLIAELKRQYEVPVSVFTSQKMIKEGKLIDKIKQMDKIEMTEYLRKLIQEERIRFPAKPSPRAKELEDQLSYFSKHSTVAGSVDYYAPGGEQDDMVVALKITCFAVRHELEAGEVEPVIRPLFESPQPSAETEVLNMLTKTTY